MILCSDQGNPAVAYGDNLFQFVYYVLVFTLDLIFGCVLSQSTLVLV